MVEKAGHKTLLKNHRIKWIDELKPKPSVSVSLDDDDPFADGGSEAPRQPSRIAPVFEKSMSAGAAPRPGTPGNDHPGDDDLFGDGDIYNATPRRDVEQRPAAGDVPDDDDLDALMAEAEANGTTTQSKDTARSTIPTSFGSIFGGGGAVVSKPASRPAPSGEPDEDDLDALMAEAEVEAQAKPAPAPPAKAGAPTSLFGGGEKAKETPATVELGDDDDIDALMAEAEAMAVPPASEPRDTSKGTAVPSTSTAAGDKAKEVENPKVITSQDYDDDDLDALMAEAEAEAEGLGSTSNAAASKPTKGQKEDKGKDKSFEDEEEAMAEMDGLW